MSRNDGSLYSGINANTVKTHRVRSDLKEVKENQRAKLSDSEAILVELIANERKQVIEQLGNLPIGIDTTEEGVKSVLLAYQMHLAFLSSFSGRVSNIMRRGAL